MTSPTSHKTADLRRINRNRVFRHLLFEAPQGVKKQDLALALGMSLPTLTQNLGELMDLGLVNHDRLGSSSGGRPPRILQVTAGARWAVGVEVSANHIRLVALDLLAQVLDFQAVARPFRLDEAYAAELARTIEAFIDRVGLARTLLLGVGLTVPGIVSNDESLIAWAPTLNLRDVPVTALTEAIPYPTHVVNDANAGGYAQTWGKPADQPMVYVSLGRGVGGAILISGGAYLGQNGRSAEFGHICVHPGGTLCSCGRKGCLEAYCSTARLSDDLGLSLEEFFARLDGGDADCGALWDQYLDTLALALGNLRMTLDCPIVLGGKLSPFLQGHMEPLEARLRAWDPDRASTLDISICRHHDRANSLGAGLRFIEGFIRQV